MRNSIDSALRDRAQRVIPNGMWGHMNAARLPAAYPQFFARGEGCRLWDVDGREYIDFMCAWGPMVLGYRDADVEAAADAQRARATCSNGPTARLVELAELMVETVPHADWAMFQKNGTDATTTCAMIARAATGKRKVLVARGAYHGAVPWCNPYPAGATAEDRVHVDPYDYNDVQSLEPPRPKAGDDLAAVIVSAFKHDLGKDHELPTRRSPARRGALRRNRRRPDRRRCARRFPPPYGRQLGTRGRAAGSLPPGARRSPTAMRSPPSPAMTASARRAGAVFVTGSFWTEAVPMAAAIATIRKLKAVDGVGIMQRMGQRLRDGIEAQANPMASRIRQSGPPQMPVVLFDDDPERKKGWLFCTEALKRGVYLHAAHTMFLCAAHGDADIDRALAATDEALREVARQFGIGPA